MTVLGLSSGAVARSWEDLAMRLDQRGSRPTVVCSVAPYQYWVQAFDREYREYMRSADVVITDGSWVVSAMRRAGVRVSRLTGRELVERLAAGTFMSGWRIAVIGGAGGPIPLPESWSRLSTNISIEPTDVEVELALSFLSQMRPQVVLVALGCPKQERFISRLLPNFSAVYAGVGGAIDTLQGAARPPSAVLIALRLEWLSRLLQHPKRLAGRTVRAAVAVPILQLWGIVDRLRQGPSS